MIKFIKNIFNKIKKTELEIEKKEEKRFLSRETGLHLFGYSVVGGISNTLEIGYLFLFKEIFGMWYILASGIAFTIGSVQTFLGRKFFVFKDPDIKKIPRQISLYSIVFAIGIGLNFIIMSFFVEVLHVHYIVAYIISILFTGIVGFLWNKLVTFKN